MWQELQENYKDSVQFIEFDATLAENREMIAKYLVRAIPKIIFVNSDETTLLEVYGYQDYEHMEILIKDFYGETPLDESR